MTFLAYAPVVFNEFVDFDDPIYVTANQHVQAGLTPASLWFAWSTWEHGNWHPLTWMSLELDFALFGQNPVAFHLMNVFWHASCALLLFWWLLRTTAKFYRSLVVAALFALHPLHVESAAWVAERKDVLSGFFLLLTLRAYDWYVRRPDALRHLAVTAVFACGLMCKSILVTVPLLLFLVDLWPARRQSTLSQRMLEKSPWLAMSMILGITTLLAQTEAGAVSNLRELSLPGRIENSLIGFGFYLTRTIWPTGLCVFYPRPFENASHSVACICGLMFLAISLWTILGARTSPWRTFGWWWFVISLLPVIGLVQTGFQAYADRYAYVPHVGLLTLVVWEVDTQVRAIFPKFARLRTVMACAAILLCMAVTLRQIHFWRDSITLWSRALSIREDNWMAHHHLSELRLERNELDLAAEHCRRLRELKPDTDQWGACLGRIALLSENWQEAESFLGEALLRNPDHPNATFNMYVVGVKLGKADLALKSLAKYCDVLPQDLDARCELGMLRDRGGDTLGALNEFQHAVGILPQAALPRMLAGSALLKLGRREEAKTRLLEAVALNPLQAEAHALLGDLFISERNGPSAVAHYQQALALAPGDERTRTKLRMLLGE